MTTSLVIGIIIPVAGIGILILNFGIVDELLSWGMTALGFLSLCCCFGFWCHCFIVESCFLLVSIVFPM